MTFLNSNMLSARTRPERFLHASCLPAASRGVRDWLPFPHTAWPASTSLTTMDVVASLLVHFLDFSPLSNGFNI